MFAHYAKNLGNDTEIFTSNRICIQLTLSELTLLTSAFKAKLLAFFFTRIT